MPRHKPKRHDASKSGPTQQPENMGNDAYLLELLDGTLVNTTALVDQVCVPV
jgi:hypothetical protein